MPNYFPCPNPACTYQFDADQLPAAAMVTCPICRTRFPYRAVAPASAPTVAESPPVDHDSNPFGAPVPAERAPRPNRLITPRNIPQGSKWNTAWILIGVAVFACFIMAGAIYTLNKKPKADKKPEEIQTYNDGNFKFRKFDMEVWSKDNALTNAMNVNGFVYRRRDPEAWVVVHFKDFKTRNPRADEMRNEMYNMLRASMSNVQKEPMEKVSIGDSPAEGIQFTSRYGDSELYGQGFSFHHHGYGYVLLFISTSTGWEKAQAELDQYRNSFAFGDRRKDWHESEADTVALFEKDMPYQLSDSDAVWEKARLLAEGDKTKGREFAVDLPTLKEHDDKATMLLRMKAPVKNVKLRRDAPDAYAFVLELEKQAGDPLEAARKHVSAKLEKDQGAERGVKVTFEPAQKTITGVAIPKSGAQVGIYNTTNSEDRSAKRFYAVSAMPLGDKLIVAVAWCREIDADIFEPYLINLAASLRERR